MSTSHDDRVAAVAVIMQTIVDRQKRDGSRIEQATAEVLVGAVAGLVLRVRALEEEIATMRGSPR